MTHRYAIEALNRTLQDICSNDRLFGGKTIVFGGDFRQVLPIIQNGSISEIIDACINKSEIWASVHRFNLTQNMRLDEESQNRSEFLLALGEGRLETYDEYGYNFIKLSDKLTKSTSLDDLIDKTFGPINYTTDFSNKMILAPKNDAVRHINDIITNKYPGETTRYYSADSIDIDDPNQINWPVEFLNTLAPSGMPPHCLTLKPQMPCLILRNLAPGQGLCNGTRIKIVQLLKNLIEAIILNGPGIGKTIFLPRISLDASKSNLPFTLCRRQFPIQVAFAMTINKSEGQSIDHVGVYLPQPVFAHGQLYVALSRCPKFSNLNVFIQHEPNRSHTANIVYKQVLP